ncbi:hypothetical protein [Nocardioides cavernaquae]|uniref:hypothetical protein n=1 Tax=Nocardioides cavernaquae TaxID=2321396 RepID=UPI0016002096|nr:hypothetical protein [Nocardioides cavernaquae]
MLPLHIGSDHPLGMAVLILLAFGPFLLAGAVVFVVRRRDTAAEQQELNASGDGRGAR